MAGEKNDEQKRMSGDSGESGEERSGGESAGGAYPNPHRGKKPGNGGFLGHGGQTEMPYHGGGRLGDDEVGGNANAPAKKASPDA